MSQIVYQAQASQSEYGDCQQSAMYIPVSGLYYQTESQQGAEENQSGADGNVGNQMLVEQQDGTLLLYMDGGHAEMPPAGDTSMDEDGRLGSHVDVKFCKQEMDFLHENYEAVEGASMPRSLIYNQYRRHCRRQLGGITPMNPASFGKLIRLVFAGIKTRRLGTRGNSKYHYYGIRIKGSSILNQLVLGECDEGQMGYDDDEEGNETRNAAVDGSDGGRRTENENEGATALQLQHQQFLGDASLVVLDFGSVKIDDNELLPEGVTVEHIGIFETMYHAHCEELLEAVKSMQLAAIPELWQQFWSCQFWSCPMSQGNMEEVETLSPDTLKDLGCVESLQKYVRQSDYTFYTILIDILIPDVLRPIPNSLTLVLRNFAKNLERWLDASMVNVAKEMVEAKKAAANAFAQLLRRYTGLNHLAQAARTILQNRAQVNRMFEDLCKVDFIHIQEQASWVCQCEDSIVHQLLADVKKIFQSHYSLEMWASWLDDITTYILQEHVGTEDFSKAARRLILSWSFYSSLVLRDLTLRSASSFGAFHLIRLMFDEYISYTIEHKVAAATGVSSVAAFGDIKQFTDFSNIQPLESFVEPSAGYAAEDVEEADLHHTSSGYAVDTSSSLDDHHRVHLASTVGADMFSLATQALSYIDRTTEQMQPPPSSS